MTTIFTIQILALADKIRPNFFGPPGFPLSLLDVSYDFGCDQKYFSTRNKALSYLKKQLKHKKDSESFEKIIYIQINSSKIDSNNFVNYEVLNKDLKTLLDNSKMNKKFKGSKSKYNIGDWVIFFEGTKVHCGIIGAASYSKEEIKKQKLDNLTLEDNLYYILWDNFRNPKDEFAHSHLQENFIIQKIPSDENSLKTYLTSLTIEKLKKQFKEYTDQQNRRKYD